MVLEKLDVGQKSDTLAYSVFNPCIRWVSDVESQGRVMTWIRLHPGLGPSQGGLPRHHITLCTLSSAHGSHECTSI